MATVKAGRPSILVIVVDQLRFDFVTRRRMPKAAATLESGGATLLRCDASAVPTITETIHANLSTGEYPLIHGIIGKEWFSRQQREKQEIEFSALRELNTLSLAAASNGYAVFAVGGKPHATQIVATPYARYVLAPIVSNEQVVLGNYTDPPELPRWVHPDNRVRKKWVERDGVLVYKTPEFDQWIANVALDLLAGHAREGPILLFVLLSGLDFVGHEHLPGSEEHTTALQNVDKILVTLTEAARQTLGKDTVILALGDHGVRAIDRGIFKHSGRIGFREFTIDRRRRTYRLARTEMELPPKIQALIAHAVFDGGTARFWATDIGNLRGLFDWVRTQFIRYGTAYRVGLRHSMPSEVCNGAHARLGDIVVIANKASGFLKEEWMDAGRRIIVGEHGTGFREDRIVPCLLFSGRNWLRLRGGQTHIQVSRRLGKIVGLAAT